jgi:hypothetical protein
VSHMPIARQRLGKSATETLDMVRLAFGEHSLSRTAVLHPYAVAEIWKLYDRNSLHVYSGVRRCLQILTTEHVAFLHQYGVAEI